MQRDVLAAVAADAVQHLAISTPVLFAYGCVDRPRESEVARAQRTASQIQVVNDHWFVSKLCQDAAEHIGKP